MAIAISDFEALCGFVSSEELIQVLTSYPELQPCLGAKTLEVIAESPAARRQQLKATFTSLMTCDPAKVSIRHTAYECCNNRLLID